MSSIYYKFHKGRTSEDSESGMLPLLTASDSATLGNFFTFLSERGGGGMVSLRSKETEKSFNLSWLPKPTTYAASSADKDGTGLLPTVMLLFLAGGNLLG
eukprot:Tbor_TRINITY_DN3115_c0_g1::TRINITY_DN3115_c0_g1_i1::g.14774::m.14774